MTGLQTSVDRSLHRAAERARLAPSVHNSQPWRLRVGPDSLELWADHSRQVPVLDPTGRQLMISCGCALFNARAALAADGYRSEVQRFPDPTQPNLLARLQFTTEASVSVAESPLAILDRSSELRRTNRRQFADEQVPNEVLFGLVAAAAAEGAQLFLITDPEHRFAVADLSQQADAEQNANPAYRAEMREWTTDDPHRRDGVPAAAVPHVTGNAQDDIPIRDFDTHGRGELPTETRSRMRQSLLLLGTATDDPQAWLAAGEALERVWLEATRQGYATGPLTQIVELPRTRMMLRRELNLAMYPLVLMRIGRAPTTPATPRRALSDLLLTR
ncbi:Nitroreductase family protein [Frankineae bacterium MT45]|nr:Nitroreductase family protein [Frankineae bacterium MT45]